jgi:flagellar hook-associated protein FlgK
MEQTIAFVLGVLLVAIPVVVYSMFRTSKKVRVLGNDIEYLTEVIEDLERSLENRNELVDRRIDQEIDRLNVTSDKIYKYIDSRTDKIESRTVATIDDLENKIYSDMNAKFNDNTGFVDKLFHQIADLGKSKKQK